MPFEDHPYNFGNPFKNMYHVLCRPHNKRYVETSTTWSMSTHDRFVATLLDVNSQKKYTMFSLIRLQTARIYQRLFRTNSVKSLHWTQLLLPISLCRIDSVNKSKSTSAVHNRNKFLGFFDSPFLIS